MQQISKDGVWRKAAQPSRTMSCAAHATQALLSPLALAIDSRDASACWLLLREGVLRDHPEAVLTLRDACTATKLQPCQQLLSWVRRAKDTGTTNCLRPKAALATATAKEQWSPARREAGCSGQALLACCRVVAVLDEIHDCIEEAPDKLTAATTPRFLERVLGIAQRHVCRHLVQSGDPLGAALQDAAARVRALIPAVADEARERPAAALRALLVAATADAACPEATSACKQCEALRARSAAPVAKEAPPPARATVAVVAQQKQKTSGGPRRPSPLVPDPKSAATTRPEPPPKPPAAVAPKPQAAVVPKPAVPVSAPSDPLAHAKRVAGKKQPCRPVAKGVSGPVSSGTPPSKKPAPSSKKPAAAGKKPAAASNRPALKQIEGQRSLTSFFAPR